MADVIPALPAMTNTNVVRLPCADPLPTSKRTVTERLSAALFRWFGVYQKSSAAFAVVPDSTSTALAMTRAAPATGQKASNAMA